MSQDHDEILMQYLSKVGELQKNRSNALPADELKSIAQELGLSPEDLQAAEQSAKDHLARGKGFAKHGLLDDALKELGNALALSPYDHETMLLVADTHLKRWHKKRNPADKNEADRLAREVLKDAPGDERAFDILKRLNDPPKRTKLIAALAGSAALCAVGGGAVVFLSAGAPKRTLRRASSRWCPALRPRPQRLPSLQKLRSLQAKSLSSRAPRFRSKRRMAAFRSCSSPLRSSRS